MEQIDQIDIHLTTDSCIYHIRIGRFPPQFCFNPLDSFYLELVTAKPTY
jgi:hypothetical protein